MARTRQIYQSAALFASPSPATGYMFSSGNSGVNLIQQLPRSQNASISFSLPRTDVQQFGNLSRIDQIVTQPPTANINFSYYPIDGKAESILGFATDGTTSFISGLLDNTQGEKNYFLQLAAEGFDAVGFTNSGLNNVISVSNAFISNYSINLAVGALPTVSASAEGLNAQFDTGSWLKNTPAVIPENGQVVTGVKYSLPVAIAYTGANIPSALRPGDIVLELPISGALGSYLSGANSVNVQSVAISVPLSRSPIQRLGSPFPGTRVINFPVISSLSIDALATEVRESKLSDLLCNDNFYNFRIRLKKPNCSGQGADAMIWDFKNAKMESQDTNLAVGDIGATVRFTFTSQIGGLGDTTNGIFLSGSHQFTTGT